MPSETQKYATLSGRIYAYVLCVLWFLDPLQGSYVNMCLTLSTRLGWTESDTFVDQKQGTS